MKSKIHTILILNREMMYKKLFTIIVLAGITSANAQVIIGDNVGTVLPVANKTSVLLEFSKISGENKGIIVPYVRQLPTSANARTEGTILLDASDPTKARMKFYNGNTLPSTNGWVDLSGQDGNLTGSGAADIMASQPSILNAPESNTSRAIIGVVPDPIPANFPEGVLVLNSTTKAMVLPQVAKVSDIPSPSPGMIVYVTGVTPSFKKRLAVFNGTKWSYWKP